MTPENLDYIQKKIHVSRNFENSKKFWKSEKNWNSHFQNFGKIDLIILPNRSNRSNRKKSLNRLDRFIGQRINSGQSCMFTYPLHTIKFIPEIDMLFLCRNSQSFHLNTRGVSHFTTQNISQRGSFRTFIVHGRHTAPERVRKRSEFGRK